MTARESRRIRRARPRALLAITLLFGTSALLRLGDGVGRAFASEPAAVAAGQAADAAACPPPSEEVAQVLAALRGREEDIALREQKAADLEQKLAIARDAIEKKLAELESAENRLAETVAIADKAADQDIATLVAVYQAMKPAEAARLFEQMDPSFAAGFLARMQPESAAAILAGIDPAKAYTISVVLAGRNAAAPKE